jgi:hypothetical protein
MKLLIVHLPYFPVTSSLFGPNILPTALFFNTLSRCSSLNVRHKVPHLYFNIVTVIIAINIQSSRVSSGSIVSDYGLNDRAIGVRSAAGAKDSSSNLCVHSGSGAHPASCPVGTGGPFPGGKARPRRDSDHSPPSSTEVVNE